MIAFRNRIAFSMLSIVATVGLAASSDPAAAAAPDGVRQAAIRTADLDLRNPEGRATFERRIAAAARTVCTDPMPLRVMAEDACRRNAVLQARHAAGFADNGSN